MAADISLLTSFVDGQGAGAQTYVTYPEDLDSNFATLESSFNTLNAEFRAFGGNNNSLILDLTTTATIATGFVGADSFAPVAFSAGDTVITIPPGVAFTAANGRIDTGQAFMFTGSGASGTRWFALNADGTVTQETAATQGVLDLYSVTWTGAVFTPGTLVRLPSGGDIIVDADDFQAQRIQEEIVALAQQPIPAFTYDQIASRIADIVRVMAGVGTAGTVASSDATQAALNPIAVGGDAGNPGLVAGNPVDGIGNTTGFFGDGANDAVGVTNAGTESALWNASGQRTSATQGRVKATNASIAAFPDNALTDVALNAESYDQGGYHDNVTANDRLTVPAGGDFDGNYSIRGSVTFDESTSAGTPNTGDRALEVRLNDTTVIARIRVPAAAAGDSALAIPVDQDLVAGDFVNLRAFQDSGGTMTLIEANLSARFED